jgi:outer membrane biosynthesis protein TonB
LERPGSSLLASIAVHGAVVLAVVGYGMLGLTRAPLDVENAVPVSIISETVIEAAAPDNPDEELVTEDAATAPVAPTPPEPVPPEPAPLPAPTPVKKATPPRPTPPRVTPPPRPQPPRPTPPRREESLDLDALAGPPRPGPRPGPRPPTGQQGQGTAPRAIGRASLQALASQVTPHWNVNCDLPGSDDLIIGVRVTLDQRGTIVGSPRLTQSRGDPVWRAAADGVLRAMRAAAPFDMPSDYQQQEIAFSFRTATMCGGR